MENNKSRTCCFAGYRNVSEEQIGELNESLDKAIGMLIDKGVTNFISGGEQGFDMIAAGKILERKKMGYQVNLTLMFPCKGHSLRWRRDERRKLSALLSGADELIYASEEYTIDCSTRQITMMMKASAYCVCAMNRKSSGMSMTAKLAQGEDVQMICVAVRDRCAVCTAHLPNTNR